MQKSIYRDVLKKSWEIVLNNKMLWLFGLIVALLGTGGEFHILMKALSSSNQGAPKIVHGLGINGILNIHNLLVHSPLEFSLILMASFAILFLVGFLIWTVIVAQVSLINGIDKEVGNKKINFKESIGMGVKKFSSILGLNAISEIFVYSILFLLGAAIMYFLEFNFWFYAAMYLIFFLILAPAAIIIAFIVKYAIAYVVLKNKDFFESIRLAVKLFLNNWIVSLEMAFILCLINIIVGVIAILLVMMISIPLSTVAFLYYSMSYYAGAWVAMILMTIFDVFVIGFAGAFLATFQWTNWVILFKKLNSRETVVSKIERVVMAVPGWVKGLRHCNKIT